MIDIDDLSTRPDVYRSSQKARGEDPAIVDAVLHADAKRREAINAFEELRAQQNVSGKEVAAATGAEKEQLIAEAKKLAQRVKKAQADAESAREEQKKLVAAVSNLIIEGVPHGGENNYAVLKTVGKPRDFAAEGFEPRDHLDIGERIGAIDMERGAKVSGARFYFLTGVGARLEIALLQLAFNQAVEHGFIPMITPTLVRTEIMEGTGFTVAHNDEIYRLDQDRLYLTGTSEVALAGYHADEIVDLSSGPRRYVGWSSCYRREAGSHGKDTRGIIRVHQFNKVEMFSCITAEKAAEEHLQLLRWEEEMLGKVELHYRIIDTAAGDLGLSAARKYDSEAWMPSQNAYRELTSTSNCTTFQARRLKIRERLGEAKGAKTRTVATLNGTLATTRWLAAILEQHQNPDGSVNVPQALRPYLGGMDVLSVLN